MESLYANTYIILALVATAITLLLSVDFRAVINLSSNDSKTQDGTGEFYILPLLACVGITSLCKAANLVELFVSLEVLTLSSFIMVGYFRRNLGSTEAGIKYLILGAVSTGFLVFGLAWYFGMTGPFEYHHAIVMAALSGQTAPGMFFALALLLLGTAFKIGAVPMQLCARHHQGDARGLLHHSGAGLAARQPDPSFCRLSHGAPHRLGQCQRGNPPYGCAAA